MENETMYAIITDDRSGETLAQYTLKGADPLDARYWADHYLTEEGGYRTIDEGEGDIPSGCADITCTIQEEPGSVVCWESESFFLNTEEY
jgi:hypothetical protein